MLPSELKEKIEIIKSFFRNKTVVVAYSGGVDSAVVGKLAQLYSKKAFLVTGNSLTVPPGELKEAKEVALEIGLEHLVIETDEMDNQDFIKNPVDRCYFCKSELSKILLKAAKEKDADSIVEGTNYSDIISKDHRPGYKAVSERGIKSPLVEARITKSEIRELAREWNLSIAEKPSMACLSSRFPYGEVITPEKLTRVGEAECYLQNEFQIEILRVRDHDGIARIEISPAERHKILNEKKMDEISKHLVSLGFKYVTLDLKGYRSGALNEVLS